MVACAFISLFQSYPLIPFIRLSLCLAGFHVEKRPHTLTPTHTKTFRLLSAALWSLLQYIFTSRFTRPRETENNLAESLNQSISVIQTAPLLPEHPSQSPHLSRRRRQRAQKKVIVTLKKIIKELQKLTENSRIRSNM